MNKKAPFEAESNKIEDIYKMILEKDFEWTDEAKKEYSTDLIDLVNKLLVKEIVGRLGTGEDMKEVLDHSAFKNEISADKVAIKPTPYNFDKNFFSMKIRKPVSAELIDNTDYVEKKKNANAAYKWNKISDMPAEKGTLKKSYD